MELLTLLQAFYCHWCCIVPQSLPDLSELSVAKSPHEFQTLAVNLPLVAGGVRQPGCNWFLDLEEMKQVK